MAISKVSLCNRALNHLNANTIASLDEATKEGRLCNQYFDEALDTLTEEHPWNFAVERASLAQVATNPLYEYDYQFQLPNDPFCLRLLEVVDSDNNEITDFTLEGRYVLCDKQNIKIKYLKRLTNLSETSSLFRRALEYYLAAILAEPILRSGTVSNEMSQRYRYFLLKAKAADGKQGRRRNIDDNDFDWISARYLGW